MPAPPADVRITIHAYGAIGEYVNALRPAGSPAYPYRQQKWDVLVDE